MIGLLMIPISRVKMWRHRAARQQAKVPTANEQSRNLNPGLLALEPAWSTGCVLSGRGGRRVDRLPGLTFWFCRSFLREKGTELAGVSSGRGTGPGSTYPRAWHKSSPQHRLGVISRANRCRGEGVRRAGDVGGSTRTRWRGARPLACRRMTGQLARPAAFCPPPPAFQLLATSCVSEPPAARVSHQAELLTWLGPG